MLSALLSLALLICMIPAARADDGFTDVGDHWAKAYIDFVTEQGLFSGATPTTFEPETTMTRGMFVTVLGRLERVDRTHWTDTSVPRPFTDVDDTLYYAPYVSWAVCNGIVDGNSPTTFAPDAPITREQMAKLVAFYVERMGYTLHDAKDTSTIPETFADADRISDYAVDSVETLRRTGILNGSQNADGTVSFQPAQTATRAECAAVFYRLANNVTASLVRPAAPTAMDFANESVTLRIPHDASRQLVLACAPREASAYRLVWKSSKPDVATVDQNGLVTAKAVGTTTISVYSSNGLSASCTVTCVSTDLPSADETYEERCERLFGERVSDPRTYYKFQENAEADMVKVTVKVWDFNASGEKVTKELSFMAHKNLKKAFEAMFDEIYNGSEKFPIYSISGWSWSGRSEHSCGTAIDINPKENYYCDPMGNPLSGEYWKPGEDPYSIPLDGEVATIMAKYGFTQGVNWSSGFKDYMHFSYFGT